MSLLDNIEYYFGICRMIFNTCIEYIRGLDYFMALLVMSLLVVAFEVFGYARFAVGADGVRRNRGV